MMARNKPLPSQERLREILDYNQETGELFWKFRKREEFETEGEFKSFNTKHMGKKITYKSLGYLKLKIAGQIYAAHRVIWKMIYGAEPPMIDHINHNKSDNRIVNLRAANASTNGANRLRSSNNVSGANGVSWIKSRGKWCAAIYVKYKRIFLGYYDCLEEAKGAYAKAATKYFGEFARFE